MKNERPYERKIKTLKGNIKYPFKGIIGFKTEMTNSNKIAFDCVPDSIYEMESKFLPETWNQIFNLVNEIDAIVIDE